MGAANMRMIADLEELQHLWIKVAEAPLKWLPLP